MFDDNNNSVRNYYNEISYGQLDLVTVNLPSQLGWQLAPQTYAYYVNSRNGTGPYPNNTQKLAEDLVDMVDSLVDFSRYDNNLDGKMDVLVIIHTGSGAELSGTATDIWSHKWSISPRIKDNISISDYTVQPEYWVTPGDMTIGVYCHELGHGFGLPDLYDTDQSSTGIGRWCIMSYGGWNGNLGNLPAHPCAWSRILMKFATPTEITTPLNDFVIPNVNETGMIYKIINPLRTFEFFLFEHRRKIGYDFGLPMLSDGLLIAHIDNHVFFNNREWYPGMPDSTRHMIVAIEPADGLFEMEKGLDRGDSNDPFPGNTINNPNFTTTSLPSSNWYLSPSNVSITDIRRTLDVISFDFAHTDTVVEPPDTVVDPQIQLLTH